METIRFQHPHFLLLLAPLALAAWAAYRRGAARGVVFAPVARLKPLRLTWRTCLLPLLPAVFLAGAALIVLALARPCTTLSRSRREVNAIAIQMVVDISGSMAGLDFSLPGPDGPTLRTRLNVVKDVFGEFVKTRRDDLIGLVTFGGYATTRCPLTLDHDALLHVLGGVEIPRPEAADGAPLHDPQELLTAVGDALATACARLDAARTASRIVVLLSDGESNTGIIRPEDAMLAARELGVKVYTIGVGSRAPAPYRATDEFGRPTTVLERVVLDEALLRAIADTTGGRYFNVTDPDGLAAAVDAIGRLEKTPVTVAVYNLYTERFGGFLAAGLALAAAAAWLNVAVGGRVV